MKPFIFRSVAVGVFCLFLFLVTAFPPVRAFDLKDYTNNIGLISGGIERTYDLYDPYPNIEAKRPLVIVLHGYTGSVQKIMNDNNPNRTWLDLARRERFIVAIPNGLVSAGRFKDWNDCRKDKSSKTHSDDLGFIKLLIHTLIREKNVDAKRIYVTGTSNGGHMSLRVALEAPEIVAAISPVAAAMPQFSACEFLKKPVPVLFINGTEDPLLPYEGGRVAKEAKQKHRGTVLSVENSVAWWVINNGADPRPVITDFSDHDPEDGTTARKYLYFGPAPVALIKVIGGGHTEPS
ncbi:MAG: PHB depolymerase family esterase, partial [Alphaproteobacteria bacterium]